MHQMTLIIVEEELFPEEDRDDDDNRLDIIEDAREIPFSFSISLFSLSFFTSSSSSSSSSSRKINNPPPSLGASLFLHGNPVRSICKKLKKSRH
jgi:hypothetical protein